MTTNYAHSIKAKLLNLSKQENIQYQQLLTRYFQERLLFRLSISYHRSRFILKGGALLYAYEQFAARPTLDIDFMGTRIAGDKESVKAAFREICEIEYIEDGVVFHADTIETDDIAIEKKYPGVRIIVEAQLDSIRQAVSMDICFGDVVIPSPVDLDYPVLLPGFPATHIVAYSLETVVAEKFQTMVVRSTLNSRMKDFFDLYRIKQMHQLNKATLSEAIKATFQNRGTQYDEHHILFSGAFSADKDMEIRWKSYLKKLRYQEALDFGTVVQNITDWLRPYWNELRDI
jgi:predicted nucleotidyltransferase component of viral defense system